MGSIDPWWKNSVSSVVALQTEVHFLSSAELKLASRLWDENLKKKHFAISSYKHKDVGRMVLTTAEVVINLLSSVEKSIHALHSNNWKSRLCNTGLLKCWFSLATFALFEAFTRNHLPSEFISLNWSNDWCLLAWCIHTVQVKKFDWYCMYVLFCHSYLKTKKYVFIQVHWICS